MSYYDWLEINLPKFLINLGMNEEKAVFESRGLIRAHGDKCGQYRQKFDENGLPFEYGVAIYLLTYVPQFSTEVRETVNGWVAPVDWIINNKDRFLPYLPKIGDNI